MPKRFRIAFSFAGEKRDFVEKVARILAELFGEAAILYDKNFEASFARAGLAFSLPELYHKETDLIVTMFCPDYEKKEWCGLEWSAIYGIIKQGHVDQVMLTRFDRVDGKGLYGLAGFIELDHKTPQETAKLILERLADNEGLPKDHYTKPAAPPAPVLKTDIPHNLPTLQPFFGREEELKKIADALDPDSRTWGALIDGPGGMGKTSLAVRAAYDAPPDVFKKIIFISLKTRELDDDGVRDLSGFILSGLVELLNELARELGCDDIAKAPEDQRPRLLLDNLRGTQTLLVLDNLESLLKSERDTLFTFVKKLPVGCKAILTSRGRVGSGAEELILEKLSEVAALATLAELATHNPLLAQTSEAERLVLYRETSGKPLLLRWTAGQLGRGHCLTFPDARAVIGNNVLAHVDDTQGFLAGAADLIDDDGAVIVEVPYAREMLSGVEYDTVYHEHLCYFSVTALARLGEHAGLGIVRVDDVPVHGGSVRVWFRKGQPHGAAVRERLVEEERNGLSTLAAWERFAERAAAQREDLRALLLELRNKGKRVAGYGAPAKGNTLLNYCGITTELVPYTVDRNPWKVGKLTPGMHLPVRPVETLLAEQPDYVLILAWNFADEVMEQQAAYRAAGGRFIVPIPSPQIV